MPIGHGVNIVQGAYSFVISGGVFFFFLRYLHLHLCSFSSYIFVVRITSIITTRGSRAIAKNIGVLKSVCMYGCSWGRCHVTP